MLTRFSDWNGWPSFGFRDWTGSLGAFDQLRREMDRVLFDFERGAPQQRTFPTAQIEDTGSAFVVRAEVPGLTAKDVEISATASTISLKGERKVKPPEGYGVHRNERSSYRFSRAFELPAKVDADKVEAKLEHGVLTVTLPKAAEARPKQITVKAS
jgi:HSP20 family protein